MVRNKYLTLMKSADSGKCQNENLIRDTKIKNFRASKDYKA